MKTDNIIVKNSKIHGKGVFASRDFKKGETVLHWDTSDTLEEEVVQKMSNEEKLHVSFLKNKYVMMKAPEKYINHSCDANTDAKNFCDVAIRDIKKGEEVTSNYLNEMPSGTRMKCSCGSKNCIKIIEN